MTEISTLLACQTEDGGWGYFRGGSATEPTTFALLALAASGCSDTQALRNGTKWLRVNQRKDGGWGPQPGVEKSTWVTALPLMLPEKIRHELEISRAKDWLLSHEGRESTMGQRLKSMLLAQSSLDTSKKGWSFYPDTAAWVVPTAFTILGLERFPSDSRAKSRCQSGRDFLRSRQCTDLGWNHGSFRALGYDLESYPETTGIALAALHAENGSDLKASLTQVSRKLSGLRSREALCWLQLGLLAQGYSVSPNFENVKPSRSTLECALTVILHSAVNGNNPLIT